MEKKKQGYTKAPFGSFYETLLGEFPKTPLKNQLIKWHK
ncbi:hypothetical protein J546_0818 [Acinetobacter sp. 1461402]|jgi:hypothetical protein|nr:hypothetical protein J546_0818 [Acinetobacter sp. 1461402]